MSKLIIPDNHTEITLGQIMKFKSGSGTSLETVRIFCEGSVDNLELIQVDQIAETLDVVVSTCRAEFKPFIQIGEDRFAFHNDLNGIKVKEFTDLEEFCKDFEKDAHKAMAVLYRPYVQIGKRYELEDYQTHHQDNCEVFKSMPYDYYLGAIAFFLTLQEGYASNTNHFMMGQLKKLKKKGVLQDLMTLLESDGDGTIPS